ncbi:MAG: pentapeptide repeat-containing protein [Proteobacteria bacterium]|nr:pentapeptide repeat-containing protein [Pseudomonadota bacterium]
MMANEQQTTILLQGVEIWNKWREQNQDKQIDLRGVNLEKANLNDINFSHARLEGANLSFAQLEGADFTHANLRGANLSHAHLKKAHFAFAHLEQTVLLFANMRGADLRGANLHSASLEDAYLQNSDLSHAHLENAMLAYANFKNAHLVDANLKGASLKSVNLEGANVSSVAYDQKIMLRVLKETWLSPKALWKRRHDIILDTTIRCRGAYVACYGSQRFRAFIQDQDYLEELTETGFGRFLCFVWWMLSNCGRSITRWAVWSFLFILLFALIFMFMGPKHFYTPKLEFNSITMIYYSVVTFTTLGGDIFPNTSLAAILTIAEVLIGYLMLGGLISIFASKLARRGS